MFVRLVEKDLELRQRLIQEGKLFGRYDLEMEALHIKHANILKDHLQEHGWPQDDEESRAAWLILQHAISMPELQKQALLTFRSQPTNLPDPLIAALEDRALTLSGQKQKWGTSWDWDENGELNPTPIEDEENVNARRASAGLDSIEECAIRMRARSEQEGESAPADREQFLRGKQEWARRVGWNS